MSSKNVIVNVIWHSQADACVKCLNLNGQIFFDVNIFESVLKGLDNQPVWDFDQNISLMHGGVGTCRCFLEYTFEVKWEELENAWRQIRI